MASVGTARTFDKKFAFRVNIPGFGSMGFMKCSALESETADIKHFEGGSLIANKSAGRVEFKDVTLERGATQLDYDSVNWYHQVATGAPESTFKRDVELQQLDRAGNVIKKWVLFQAWPKNIVLGEWDNNVDENTVEKLTLCYDYFQKSTTGVTVTVSGGAGGGGISGSVSVGGTAGGGGFSITGGGSFGF